MDVIISLADKIVSASSFITLPSLIFIISLIIGMKIGRAATCAIQISISLIGISVIFSFFNSTSAPVITRILSLAGKSTQVIDTGWATMALFIWSNNISYIIIPIAIAVNLLLLARRWTSTFNIDVWNLWHLAVPSILIYSMTRSIILVIISDVIMTITNLKLADWTQPVMSKIYKGKGNIANSHFNSLTWFPFAILGNTLLDRLLPARMFQNKKQYLNGKQFANQLTVSITVGLAMSLASGLNLFSSIEFALKIAAVFMILPRVVSFMQEGFRGISQAMEQFASEKKIANGMINVGVNHLIYTDADSVIVSSIILMPIMIVSALSLDFISILPLADLSNIVALIVVINAVTHGNVLKNIIISIPVVIINLSCSSYLAPFYTNLASSIGFDTGVGDNLWNSSLNGNNVYFIWLADALTGKTYALFLIPIVAFLAYLCWWYFNRTKEQVEETDSGIVNQI